MRQRLQVRPQMHITVKENLYFNMERNRNIGLQKIKRKKTLWKAIYCY